MLFDFVGTCFTAFPYYPFEFAFFAQKTPRRFPRQKRTAI
jgi:hypothetical protein